MNHVLVLSLLYVNGVLGYLRDGFLQYRRSRERSRYTVPFLPSGLSTASFVLRSSQNVSPPNIRPLPKIDYSDDVSAPFLQNLSEAQRSVVTAGIKNIRVQAGPGSGKTRCSVEEK